MFWEKLAEFLFAVLQVLRIKPGPDVPPPKPPGEVPTEPPPPNP